MLGVSRTWLYDAAKDGRVPAVRIGGLSGPVRFVRADLERWLDEARGPRAPHSQPPLVTALARGSASLRGDDAG